MPEDNLEKRISELDRVNQLILQLEHRLALLTPNRLKRLLSQKLREVDYNLEFLVKSIQDVHALLCDEAVVRETR
jgi:hypothetical protein